MNVGWVGFIGSITGYSSSPVGICEKVGFLERFMFFSTFSQFFLKGVVQLQWNLFSKWVPLAFSPPRYSSI